MIKLLRVDHRLLHGQVAFSWTSFLQADCILIASDNVVNDQLRLTTIKLAKPSGVKLVIKNIEDSIKALKEGKTDKYRLFIVVESVGDAARMARAVKTIKRINLGGTRPKENTISVSKVVHLTEEEISIVNELSNAGVEVEVRQVPNDSKVNAVDLIKNKIS